VGYNSKLGRGYGEKKLNSVFQQNISMVHCVPSASLKNLKYFQKYFDSAIRQAIVGL
jgi:hypothetical protein